MTNDFRIGLNQRHQLLLIRLRDGGLECLLHQTLGLLRARRRITARVRRLVCGRRTARGLWCLLAAPQFIHHARRPQRQEASWLRRVQPHELQKGKKLFDVSVTVSAYTLAMPKVFRLRHNKGSLRCDTGTHLNLQGHFRGAEPTEQRKTMTLC